MKTVKLFGKSIPMLAILLIAVIGASAAYGAVVNYLSATITTKTAVTSPMEVSGKLEYWPASKGFLMEGNGGTAEWSRERANSGEYSAKLVASTEDNSEAGLFFGYGKSLSTIDGDIEYSVYEHGAPMHNSFVVLSIDTDNDTEADCWIVEYDNLGEGMTQDTWVGDTFGPGCWVWVDGTRTGLGADEYTYPCSGEDTLSALRGEYFGATYWGNLKVLQISIVVGMTELTETKTIYVDDVSGCISSDCEPEVEGFTGEELSVPVVAGSELYLTFDIESQANQRVDGLVEITVTSDETDLEGAGAEFTAEPTDYLAEYDEDKYVYTLDATYTFDPLTPIRFPAHYQLSAAVVPDTYTFSVRVIPSP